MANLTARTAFMALSFAVGASPTPAIEETPTALPRIESIDCAKLSSVPPDQKASCGVLLVKENRALESSPTIRLPFLVLRSRSATPEPDPVVFMSGGPGNNTIRPRVSGSNNPILDRRDYILFEQRGAKLAEPSLPCVAWGEAEVAAATGTISSREAARRKVAASRACAGRARGQGIDLRMYNSTAAAADVNDLRLALGVDKLNLYGLSYSAGIMMRVVRDYPEAVRSVVLNSPLPIEASYDEQGAAGLSRALGLVFEGCALDPACSAAFPDPRSQMIAVISRANREPFILNAPASEQPGKTVQVRADGRIVAEAFLGTLNEPNQIEVLPRIIDQAFRGNHQELSSLISIAPSNYFWLMRLAVWCNEETPFESAERIAAQRTRRYIEIGAHEPEVHPPGVCEAMGLGDVKPHRLENEAVVSDIPVLLVSGEFDPYTPVPVVRRMLDSLSNAYHIVVAGNTHNAGFSRCAMQMSAEFYRNPRQAPDAACLWRLRGSDFSKAAQPVKPQG